MKKRLLGFITVMLVAASFVLVGCQKQDNFHTKTATMANEFFQNEDYAFLFEDEQMDYGAQLNLVIYYGFNKDYTIIKNFYEESLRNFTLIFTAFGPNLNIEPQNKSNNVKSAYKNFENEIKNLQNSANDFLQKKDIFIEKATSNPSSAAAKAELQHFKAEYKNLLFKAKDFFESFKQVYNLGYLAYPTANINTLQPGLQKLTSIIAIGNLTALNLEYMFDDMNPIEHTSNSLKLLQETSKIKLALETFEEQTQTPPEEEPEIEEPEIENGEEDVENSEEGLFQILKGELKEDLGDEDDIEDNTEDNEQEEDIEEEEEDITQLQIKKIKNFLETEEIYNTEISHFKLALQNFDFNEYDLAQNKDEYLDKNNNRVYFNKIQNFINTYTPIYVNSIIDNVLYFTNTN